MLATMIRAIHDVRSDMQLNLLTCTLSRLVDSNNNTPLPKSSFARVLPAIKSSNNNKYNRNLCLFNTIRMLSSKKQQAVSIEGDLDKMMAPPRNTTIETEIHNATAYEQAMQDLNSLQSNSLTLQLAKYRDPEQILPLFRRQLNLAGISVDDIDRLNVVHVSGTKGKGSTCAFIDKILLSAGLKTGFYNSPHLIRVSERIKVNGAPLDDEKFTMHFRRVFDKLKAATKRENISMPSYFSFLTILAFHIYLEEKVDCAIMEVGMGGEYDPTNIVRHPIACAITTLDFDHTNILGNTIEKIAWAKAGIAKSGAPLFTIRQDYTETLQVIESRCTQKQSPLVVCKPWPVDSKVSLGIQGVVQYSNAALAATVSSYVLQKILPVRSNCLPNEQTLLQSEGLEVSQAPQSFIKALENCHWPGRCQVVRYPRVSLYLDGAHTRKSMENCLDWFLAASCNENSNAKRILMTNVIGVRDKREVLRPLAKCQAFEEILFCTNKLNYSIETPANDATTKGQCANSEKSIENATLNAAIWDSLRDELGQSKIDDHPPKRIVMPDIFESMKHLASLLERNDDCNLHILVTGSLHFVGAVMDTLQSCDRIIRS